MVGTFGFGSGGGVESAITAHASTHLNGGTDPIGNLPLLNVTQTFSAYQTLSAGLAVQGGTTLTGAFNLVTSGNTASITGNTSIVGGLTVSAGLTLSSGGISVTGNSSVAGTFSTTGLYTASGGITVSSGGLTVSSGVLTVSSGGVTVTGNSTITGTLGGLTGLTVASGGASITGNSTITGTLGGLTGLTVASGNVGIGKSTFGSVTTNGVWLQSNDSAYISANTANGVLYVNQNGAGPLVSVLKSGVEKFQIDTNGNVGIGTSGPTAALDVVGAGKFSTSLSIGTIGYTIDDNTVANQIRLYTNTAGKSLWVNAPGGITLNTNTSVTGSVTATHFIPSGLTGATTAVRIVGGTINAPPASGTFVAGDMVIGSSGAIYICTTGGTPGVWTTVGGGATTNAFTKSLLLMGA